MQTCNRQYESARDFGFDSGDRFLPRNPYDKVLIKIGIENGFEEDSKLENSSLLGSDWGDGARGQ